MDMDNRCIQGLNNVPQSLRGCVLTIGNFDGVHVGHQRILQTARRLANEKSVPLVAVTFEPPPDLIARPDDVPQRLLPADRKTAALLEVGVDAVVLIDITPEFLKTSAEQFIQRVIIDRFAATAMVEGENFFFGHDREGNVDTLRAAGESYGFEVHVVPPLKLEFGGSLQRVSSTAIRRLISAGDVAQAAALLGRAYTIFGPVVSGKGHGRVLSFPTVNVDTGQQIIPAHGVYAGSAEIENQNFTAAISVGTKMTLGPGPLTVEAHLIDAEGDYYNRQVALKFIHRIRSQQKVENENALKMQIAKDVQSVRKFSE